jgi:hypothetical protein
MTKGEKKNLYALVRKVVIARDGNKCLRCKKTTVLQLSHIYPKGTHRRMEFDPDNLKILCVGCHLYWWHKNPIEAWQWLLMTIPSDRMKRINLRANTVDKSPFDYKLYTLFLEQELKKYAPKG